MEALTINFKMRVKIENRTNWLSTFATELLHVYATNITSSSGDDTLFLWPNGTELTLKTHSYRQGCINFHICPKPSGIDSEQ